ncbi:hypothetical protein E2C01_051079 [Portunus trituberculatus]|uniref:Uncharacterized protein n=1 Tax=Portunus trituberculatus TaxID=210409 RepID=A0A5B7GI72_PORTR|nr:hypothetical protein [Portunus trituberculatus]
MGIRHSKKSHDIQSSPKKNGSTADTEVKIKELPEDAPVKLEEAKAVETIEEAAEKTVTTPNGDGTVEQTQVECVWEHGEVPLRRRGAAQGKAWRVVEGRMGRDVTILWGCGKQTQPAPPRPAPRRPAGRCLQLGCP